MISAHGLYPTIRLIFFDLVFGLKGLILRAVENQNPEAEISKSIPTRHYALRELKNNLKINSEWNIVDIGSGHGETVKEFSEWGFNSVVGVEIDSKSFEFSKTKTLNKKIELVHSDFLNYNIKPAPTLFYCYHVANPSTEIKIFNKIHLDMKKMNFPFQIIYHNNIYNSFEVREILNISENDELITHVLLGNYFYIYRSNN